MADMPLAKTATLFNSPEGKTQKLKNTGKLK